ncbi:MAG: lactate utilization protein [Anaerolineae bacterium]|nr:lactate utilization protein [Anaerolineae bacterium]
MELKANQFLQSATIALEDIQLKTALDRGTRSADKARITAMDETTDPEALRQQGRGAKLRALADLPDLLEQIETNITGRGGQVLWALDGDEVNRQVLAICREHDLRFGVKSKSMVTEETALVPYLKAHGVEMLETDLGEFVVQVDESHPSHIVTPIMHMTKEKVHDLFVEKLGMEPMGDPVDPKAMTHFAQRLLRRKYLDADLGITGGNFMIAETGTVVICTNEGNGRLSTSLPRVHIAIVGIEKVVPTWEDFATLVQTLPRASTGQRMTVYTSLFNGPAGDEGDGPEHFYLILVDNGRSNVYASDYTEALACIRCGACLNTCPVYQQVGGHAYGTVYPGPIGAVLTPLLMGKENAAPLPFASSLCGACQAACPVDIHIPDMLLKLRHDLQAEQDPVWQMGMKGFGFAFSHPLLFEAGLKLSGLAAQAYTEATGQTTVDRLPPPLDGWTNSRDFPPFASESFHDWWRKNRGGDAGH